MQQTPSHHWFSSLLTGLCIVAGFGLGLSWQEWHSKSTAAAAVDSEAPPIVTLTNQAAVEDGCCYPVAFVDDDQDKEQLKPRPRPRTFVWPNNLTDDNLKRVEEALRRAQEALEKDGIELPEDFRQHFDNLRKQMAEHHKMMEKQFKQMEERFPNWREFERFPNQSGAFPRFPGLPSGEGVSIMLSRDNDSFTAERHEGSQSIKVTGTVIGDKGEADSITIKDGGKEKTYKSIKEVPAEHQDRVKELVEMAGTGRIMVHPKSGTETPKKDNKSDRKREFF
jgi:hypothetical protein